MDSPISGPVEARSSGLSVNTTGLDDISEPSPVSLVESQPNGDAHSPPVRRRQDGYFWMSVAEANSRSRRLPKVAMLAHDFSLDIVSVLCFLGPTVSCCVGMFDGVGRQKQYLLLC
eukprot:Rmarinus@m.12201